MPADVTSLRKFVDDCNAANEAEGESTVAITRDLLGASSMCFNKELDLEAKAPNGWERLLDLKTGEVHFQKINPAPKSSGFILNEKFSGAGDNDSILELKLSTPSSLLATSFSNNEGICTLEKVKSALERSTVGNGKRSGSTSSSAGGDIEEERSPAGAAMAMCGSCGIYLVVTLAEATKVCPRCGCLVAPAPAKRPRVGLNLFI